MAYKKSKIMLDKYGKEGITIKAKEFEKLNCTAIETLNKMSEIGVIYNSIILGHLMKAVGWLIDVRARTYQYNIDEYGIDKSLLKSLDSKDVDSDKIKHNTNLYFYDLVNKIFSLILKNPNNNIIKNGYIYIKEDPEVAKFEPIVSTNKLLFRPSIKMSDIIKNDISQKAFLNIIQAGTYYQDSTTYFILNAILGELQKITYTEKVINL